MWVQKFLSKPFIVSGIEKRTNNFAGLVNVFLIRAFIGKCLNADQNLT